MWMMPLHLQVNKKSDYDDDMMPLKFHVFGNIMENGAFALLEQMLHFP